MCFSDIFLFFSIFSIAFYGIISAVPVAYFTINNLAATPSRIEIYGIMFLSLFEFRLYTLL